MRPYVQVDTTTTAATTQSTTQSSSAPTSAVVSTTATNSYTKRSYDDAKKAFLNYAPSDNYVHSNLFVNKATSPSFVSSQQRTQSLWSTHLPGATQSNRCIDSTGTATTTTPVVVLARDSRQSYSSAEQSMLISDKQLLSTTPFDTVNNSTSNNANIVRSPFFAVNANTKTIDGCEVNRVKFVHCDNHFVDGRPFHVGAENEKNSCSGRTSSPMQHNQLHTLNDISNKRSEAVTPMSNSLNSSNNCETKSKCQISSDSEETTALLIANDPSKSITVRKAANASLIFTKKDSNPVVHRKKNVYLRTVSSGGQSILTTPGTDTAEDTPTAAKRHSFHWHDNSGVPFEDRKRKQVKSWYAIISPADTNEIADEDNEVSANFEFESKLNLY